MHKNEKDKYRNDIFEARYWAGRMMEKRNFIWGRWEELFTVHNDLLKWAERIMKNYKELESERDELKIRLNAAEAEMKYSVQQQARLDKAEAEKDAAMNDLVVLWGDYEESQNALNRAIAEVSMARNLQAKLDLETIRAAQAERDAIQEHHEWYKRKNHEWRDKFDALQSLSLGQAEEYMELKDKLDIAIAGIKELENQGFRLYAPDISQIAHELLERIKP